MVSRWMANLVVLTSFALLLSSIGCSQPAKIDNKPSDGKKDIGKGDTKHDEWWCQEHGIPEHLCSMCSAEVFEQYKKEGKLCKLHPDRAEEQCFKCDPSRYKKYEDMYVAKFGKKPEPPPPSEFKK